MLMDNTYDLMYIDNTHDTWAAGPAGDMVAESEQFKAWSKSAKQSFDDCKKEHSEDGCINGMDVRIAVFNLTNAVEVVLNGDLPHVQECGPISLKMYQDKKDIDLKVWDATGVAKYRVETTYEIDEKQCDQACHDLLEATVIVPNPVWAQVNAMDAEMVTASIVLVSTLALQGQLSKFDLSAAESVAFTQIFLMEKDTIKKLGLVGLFLQTAVAATTKAQAGDISGTCTLGNLELNVQRCGAILQKLMEMIPGSWAATMQMLGPMYGTGPAAPIFMQVKVKEVLGFKGAAFTDHLTKIEGLNFAGAVDNNLPQSDLPGEFRHAQMSKNFGAEGIFYNIKYSDADYDCRYDKDCTMTSPRIDSCTPSATCTPKYMKGYMGTNFPGHIWKEWSFGSSKGFDDLRVGNTFTVFKAGTTVELMVHRESQTYVHSRNTTSALEQFSPDGMLHYYDLILSSLGERLENCDGKEPGSPGLDCGSPLYTATVAPALQGVPLYISNPYFDNRLWVSMKEKHQKALKASSYHPLSRVAISRCKGNSWCDYHGYGKHNSSLWVEGNSGLAFLAHASLQYNIRIGVKKSQLYPNVNDALIPVFWASESVVPPERYKEILFDLQFAPVSIWTWFLFYAITGTWYATVGGMCCCSAVLVEKRYQKTKLLAQ
jgi:hypothetical protein